MEKIKFNQLYHSHNNITSLVNITCEFKKNKRYLIIGNKHSGKSTICNLIKGLTKRKRGSIRIDDKSFKVPTQRKLAFLAENTHLYINIKVLNLIYYYRDSYELFDTKLAINLFNKLNLNIKKTVPLLLQEEKEIILFILTLCRKADFYLLDNPLSSFSTRKKAKIIKFVFDHLDTNNCIIITTDSYDDCTSTFDFIMYLSNGYLIDQVDMR